MARDKERAYVTSISLSSSGASAKTKILAVDAQKRTAKYKKPSLA